jgi:hypothetical protein
MENKKRGPSDATDYSSTKAPDTQRHAEEQDAPPSDMRLIPGGAHGTHTPQGMAGLEREELATRADGTKQTDFGHPPLTSE